MSKFDKLPTAESLAQIYSLGIDELILLSSLFSGLWSLADENIRHRPDSYVSRLERTNIQDDLEQLSLLSPTRGELLETTATQVIELIALDPKIAVAYIESVLSAFGQTTVRPFG